ncbi:hypothetical protein Taro_004801 [Colocasia esculenta]|uniref:RRM domain-containing protein n=1 Tax=Colocasia esculenta TaxID=4460 RepID=A0A843TR62_COLES|nr:hypothetical protein [Colocasia esculenta]
MAAPSLSSSGVPSSLLALRSLSLSLFPPRAMADAYWRYADGRAQQALHAAPIPAAAPPPAKRPRPDYPDIPAGPEYAGYMPREEERIGHQVIRDTETISASYDLYLRNGQVSSFGAGESARPLSGAVAVRHVDDPHLMAVGSVDNRNIAYNAGRPEMPLPPDASNTLFVEGLPANCTRREVSRILRYDFFYIFRPFVGFREVRLVTKESRYPGGDPIVLCFADFSNPSQAAIALEALQGYKFDEHDRDSANLRLQFARFPGPRSGGGPRGRR